MQVKMQDLFQNILWNIQGPESLKMRPRVLDDDYLKFHNSIVLFLQIDFIIS